MPQVYYQVKTPTIDKYSDCIYLDPETHTKIEEVGSANFFGITKDNKFITPKSPSILPSITKYSLLYLAKERLGLEAIEGTVKIDELDQFAEAGACGTCRRYLSNRWYPIQR